MRFGGTPANGPRLKTRVRRLIFALVGWPSFLRRLQWPTIECLLELSPGLHVLEIGAGPMQFAVEIARRGCEVVATDIQPIEAAGRLSREFRFGAVGADAARLPFRDASFDRVLISSLLHMLPNPDMILIECRRILKSDGAIVFSVPSHYVTLPGLWRNRATLAALTFAGYDRTFPAFVESLNSRFGVYGPRGYYSLPELQDLIRETPFYMEAHQRAPGPVGALIWELGILLYRRLGGWVFHILFLFYPLARALDGRQKAQTGSEMIVKLRPADG